MSVFRDNDKPGMVRAGRPTNGAASVGPSEPLDVMQTRLIYDQLPAFLVVSTISAFATVSLYWDDRTVPHFYLQSWLALFLVFYVYTQTRLTPVSLLPSPLRPLLATALMALAVWPLRGWPLAVPVVVGAVVYAGAALLLDIVPESDRVYWREVVRRR